MSLIRKDLPEYVERDCSGLISCVSLWSTLEFAIGSGIGIVLSITWSEENSKGGRDVGLIEAALVTIILIFLVTVIVKIIFRILRNILRPRHFIPFHWVGYNF